jgi:hypothetical protein
MDLSGLLKEDKTIRRYEVGEFAVFEERRVTHFATTRLPPGSGGEGSFGAVRRSEDAAFFSAAAIKTGEAFGDCTASAIESKSSARSSA